MSPYSVQYLTTVIPCAEPDTAALLFLKIVLKTEARLYPDRPELPLHFGEDAGQAPAVVYLHGRPEAVTLDGMTRAEFEKWSGPAIVSH